jgi:hypothetical protein
MATLQQAQDTLALARAFFKHGEKAANKKYFSYFFQSADHREQTLASVRGISLAKAQQMVADRDRNWVASTQLQNGEGDITAGGRLRPLDVGTSIVHAGRRYGNCGHMAAVAIYYARCQQHVPRDQLFMVNVFNPNYTEGILFLQKNMTFGHSWALLGNHPRVQGVTNYVVDPWANVVCDQDDFSDELTAALNAWAGQGKRISVNWSDGKAVWTEANDAAILSLLGVTPDYIGA